MKKALVVGINNYPACPLGGCINDANTIADLLQSNSDNSPNFDVKVENDVPSKSLLKGYIHSLFQGDSDVALFYFSGHGFIDELGGYIVTPDYDSNDMGVSMNDILAIANASHCKNKIIILDCCHSGAFGQMPNLQQQVSIIGEGMTILTASKDSEPAVEINGHGIFTNLLIAALQGGAADLRGNITPGSVYAYIDQALGEWNQRPMFKTNIKRFISLRNVEAPISIEVLRKLTDYFTLPQSEYKLDSSYEYTNSPEIKHEYIKPYAEPDHVVILKDLQKLEGVGLVKPIDEDHMYFAAMNGKSCKLTSVGQHYWKLVKDRRI